MNIFFETYETDQGLAEALHRSAADVSDLIRLARSKGLCVETLKDVVRVSPSGTVIDSIGFKVSREIR